MADLVSMIWDSYMLNGLSAKSWSTVTLELHLVIDIPLEFFLSVWVNAPYP